MTSHGDILVAWPEYYLHWVGARLMECRGVTGDCNGIANHKRTTADYISSHVTYRGSRLSMYASTSYIQPIHANDRLAAQNEAIVDLNTVTSEENYILSFAGCHLFTSSGYKPFNTNHTLNTHRDAYGIQLTLNLNFLSINWAHMKYLQRYMYEARTGTKRRIRAIMIARIVLKVLPKQNNTRWRQHYQTKWFCDLGGETSYLSSGLYLCSLMNSYIIF